MSLIGKFVKIYEDPITQLKLEGYGRTVGKIPKPDEDGFIRVRVKFPSEPGQVFERITKKENILDVESIKKELRIHPEHPDLIEFQ